MASRCSRGGSRVAYRVLMMALTRAWRRGLLFLVPYALTMALLPRLGVVWALLVGLTVFVAIRIGSHAVACREQRANPAEPHATSSDL